MKIRIISATVLLIIFIPLLLCGGLPFTILMSILSVLSMNEVLKLRKTKRKIPAVLELFSYLLVASFTMNNYNSTSSFYMLDYKLMAILILINLIPLVFIDDKEKYDLMDALFLIGLTLFIGLTFNLLILIRGYNIDYVIYLFLITVTTDTFALITGKNIGRRKISPNISPNKTIEGCVGGAIMGTFIPTMFYIAVIGPTSSYGVVIFVTFILSCLGQIGDLVFSFIKREYNKKDFSNIIPGHGGILDRLDSIIFVTLGFLIFMSIL